MTYPINVSKKDLNFIAKEYTILYIIIQLMDENYKLYAKPLDKNNIYELKYSLNQLMDVLSEQNNCVRFVKNSLKSDSKNKL